jgi:hypothetical protein
MLHQKNEPLNLPCLDKQGGCLHDIVQTITFNILKRAVIIFFIRLPVIRKTRPASTGSANLSTIFVTKRL